MTSRIVRTVTESTEQSEGEGAVIKRCLGEDVVYIQFLILLVHEQILFKFQRCIQYSFQIVYHGLGFIIALAGYHFSSFDMVLDLASDKSAWYMHCPQEMNCLF